MQGTITSLKNEKTATVTVERMWQHPLYLKQVKRSKKYACHYEKLELAEGDLVEIQETKPISKTKRFVVTKKLEAEVKEK
jgi:small subunit ribosomal protein S17